MKIPMMQAIKNFKVSSKAKVNPSYAAKKIAQERRVKRCFELVKGGEHNIAVICNDLNICRTTLIRYLNRLAGERLINIYSAKGAKYKILGVNVLSGVIK